MKKLLSAGLVIALSVAGTISVPVAASASDPVCAPAINQGTNNVKPTLTLEKSSPSTQSMRVRTTWHAGQSCVQYQWATDTGFTKNVGSLSFNSPNKKTSVPSDFGRVIQPLLDNEKYYVRARVVSDAGVAGPWSSRISGTTNARMPELITGVKWSRTSDGRVKITWKHNAAVTSRFRVHLATTPFNPGKRGANHQIINIPLSSRSYTVSAQQLKALGTPIGSGRDFRFRIEAQNAGDKETRSRFSSSSEVAMAGQINKAISKPKTTVKIGSFNVVSPRAEGRNPSWSSRRVAVAKQIVNSKAGIIGLQEASTNKAGSTTQVKQLLSTVKAEQKKKSKAVKWKLVRSTRYIKPGQPGGDDGARIIYDSAKYKLVSKCSDTTGKGKKKAQYSTSCAIKLPRLGSVNYQRSASVAQFQDRKTKQKFWVVSAHLEHRKGAKYDKNRKAQVDTIFKHINKVNKAGLPVFVVGDLNSSSSRLTDYPLIDKFLKTGYYDASTAPKASGQKYATFNAWKSQKAVPSGHAARIDFILAKGKNTYVKKYTNMKQGKKASDHNLIYAEFAIQ